MISWKKKTKQKNPSAWQELGQSRQSKLEVGWIWEASLNFYLLKIVF